MPWVKYFWKIRNTVIMGMDASAAPAIRTRIDGASEAKTFVTVVLPMVKPGIGALAIFTFINSWNDYFMQLVMLASGIRMTCLGKAMAHTIRENSSARPINRFFASA